MSKSKPSVVHLFAVQYDSAVSMLCASYHAQGKRVQA